MKDILLPCLVVEYLVKDEATVLVALGSRRKKAALDECPRGVSLLRVKREHSVVYNLDDLAKGRAVRHSLCWRDGQRPGRAYTVVICCLW